MELFAKTINSLIFAFIGLSTSFCLASQNFTVQGRILNSDGTAFVSSSVPFLVQVRSPGAENCLLYQETQTLNMSSSGGAFSLTIGSGTRAASTVDGGNSMDIVFSNSATISLTAATSPCTSGTSYTPSVSSTRILVLQYYDGTAWDTIPNIPLNWVPQAMYAQDSAKLGGVAASGYVAVSNIPTCSGSNVLTYNGTTFSCVAGGSGAISATTITSSSTITDSATTSSTSTTSGALTVAGGEGIVGALNVGGSASLGETSANYVTVAGASTGNAPSISAVGSDTNVNLTLAPKGTGNTIISSGSLGIGTTSPGAKLQIGTATLDTGTQLGVGTTNAFEIIPDFSGAQEIPANTAFMQVSNTGNMVFAANRSGSLTGMTQIAYMGAGLNWKSAVEVSNTSSTYSNLYLMKSGGNVGIGTTSPTATLTVSGTIVSLQATGSVTGSSPNWAASLAFATTNAFSVYPSSAVANDNITLTFTGTPANGGNYLVSLKDPAIMTVTFAAASCGSIKYKPASTSTNVITTSGTTGTLITMTTIYNGTNYDCYVTWASGYQ